MSESESPERPRNEKQAVSPDVSVYWKPLHRLLVDGRPAAPVTVLHYDSGNGKYLPFAAIEKTQANRLVLWPPSDARKPAEFVDGHTFPIQHVTLDLSNGRTHFTRFKANGRRCHEDRGWKLTCFEDGLRLWLIGAFCLDLLQQQVGLVQQRIKTPKTDAKRREEEFRRYAGQMARVVVRTPRVRGNFLVSVIHLPPVTFRGPVKPSHFPMGRFWDDWIDGWPDGDSIDIAPTSINVSGVNLLLLTASPPGQLKAPCLLGSPTSDSADG